jgi:two-component sensor histidine kinase
MAHLREGSLGYGLVRSLVKQIGGEIDIGGDSGLTVTISFPDESQSAAENDAKFKDAPGHSLTR